MKLYGSLQNRLEENTMYCDEINHIIKNNICSSLEEIINQ